MSGFVVDPSELHSFAKGQFARQPALELGADVLRETSKQDELQSEGIPKDQRKAFERQQGYLDL